MVRFSIVIFLLLFMVLGVAKGQTGTPAGATQFAFPYSKAANQFAANSFRNFNFEFKNAKRAYYYQNKAALKKIEALTRKQELAKSLPLLEEYVSNFGIQNFKKDTSLLWQLGQLYYELESLDKAKSIFRLAIKHRRSRSPNVLQIYQAILESDAVLFLPVNTYYEMVEYRKNIDTLRPPLGQQITMGAEINSEYEDYGPAITFYGDSILFSSKRNKQAISGKTNEDIYYAPKFDGYWDPAKPLKEINTNYNEGSPAISHDGHTLFFSRCDSPDGYGNCDIFRAVWNDELGKWNPAQNLGTGVNGSAWDSQPALSITGDTLYFASDRLGGYGNTDIYYSVKGSNNQFGPAQNMGPVINTPKNEVSPFCHPVYNIFYFSSQGQLLNFGGFDIYKCLLEAEFGTEPKNIGPLVNGSGDEYYFTIDKNSKFLYYARAEIHNPKNLDLYSFPLPMEAHPNSLTKLKGTLTDSVGNPFKGTISVIDLDNGIEISPRELSSTGAFDFDLINKNNYLIVLQGEDFFKIQKYLYLTSDTVVNAKTESIKAKKIRFTTIEFRPNNAEVLEIMHNDLNAVYNFMVDNPKFKLRISGHTDGQGDKRSNLKLSKDRAQAIKGFLGADGNIDPRRIEAQGFGDSKPIIAKERNQEDRSINRRVEFELIPPHPK